MVRLAQSILEDALQLPSVEREFLVRRLLDSLGEQELAQSSELADRDPEIDALWHAEILRRIDLLDRGVTKTTPADEAMARIRANLEERRRERA